MRSAAAITFATSSSAAEAASMTRATSTRIGMATCPSPLPERLDREGGSPVGQPAARRGRQDRDADPAVFGGVAVGCPRRRDVEQLVEEPLVAGQELTAPMERDGAHQRRLSTSDRGTAR